MSVAVKPTMYLVKLHDRQAVAEDTLAFRFTRPEGFAFEAGQFVELTLTNPLLTDAGGNTRAFSIASAPHEGSLLVATRLRDTPFKRVLATLPLGARVKLEGPFGNLGLHADATRPAVFLAGGIGITPFRSMLRHASHAGLRHRMLLLSSNRRPEDAPFLSELESLQRELPSYTFVPTMTAMERSHRRWRGETGWIDRDMLSRYMGNLTAPIYYIAGPPAMVQNLQAMLIEAGIPEEAIRTEAFAGY